MRRFTLLELIIIFGPMILMALILSYVSIATTDPNVIVDVIHY